MQTYEPLFISTGISDQAIKDSIINQFLDTLRADLVKINDKLYTESEIEEILKFYTSEIGKKYIANSIQVNNELAKSYAKFTEILKDYTKN